MNTIPKDNPSVLRVLIVLKVCDKNTTVTPKKAKTKKMYFNTLLFPKENWVVKVTMKNTA